MVLGPPGSRDLLLLLGISREYYTAYLFLGKRPKLKI
jgi:hypothetical protein